MTSQPVSSLEAVLVGRVREHPGGEPGGPFARPWRSAFVKQPVDGPVRIGPLGLDGDEVANTAVHGGLEQSVLAYPGAHYPRWRRELGINEMGPGGFGENLCVSELDEHKVCIGDQFEIGSAVLQVSLPRLPCASIDRRWQRRGLSLQVGKDCRTGWYLRVLREGTVRSGDVLHRTARPLPQWTVARVLKLRLVNDPEQLEDAAQLADCELLAGHWREHFAGRLARGSGAP